MRKPTLHTLNGSSRYAAASVLTVLYLMIALSPLAPLVMKSETIARAVTGECAGDCDLCGCSRESRLSNSCCCSRKRMQQREVCVKSGAGCNSQLNYGADTRCGSTPPSREAAGVRDCCVKVVQQLAESMASEPAPAEPDLPKTVYRCGSPCGKGKPQVLLCSSSNDLLPPEASGLIFASHTEPFPSDLYRPLVSCPAEPPDPPPKVTSIS